MSKKTVSTKRPSASWQLQEAKARLSELVKKAASEGPQEITVRGEPVAVVISRAEYEKFCMNKRPDNLADFLLNSPLAGLDLEFERDQSLTREDSIFEDEQ
jgi:prevent-host-death family protein